MPISAASNPSSAALAINDASGKAGVSTAISSAKSDAKASTSTAQHSLTAKSLKHTDLQLPFSAPSGSKSSDQKSWSTAQHLTSFLSTSSFVRVVSQDINQVARYLQELVTQHCENKLPELKNIFLKATSIADLENLYLSLKGLGNIHLLPVNISNINKGENQENTDSNIKIEFFKECFAESDSNHFDSNKVGSNKRQKFSPTDQIRIFVKPDETNLSVKNLRDSEIIHLELTATQQKALKNAEASQARLVHTQARLAQLEQNINSQAQNLQGAAMLRAGFEHSPFQSAAILDLSSLLLNIQNQSAFLKEEMTELEKIINL